MDATRGEERTAVRPVRILLIFDLPGVVVRRPGSSDKHGGFLPCYRGARRPHRPSLRPRRRCRSHRECHQQRGGWRRCAVRSHRQHQQSAVESGDPRMCGDHRAGRPPQVGHPLLRSAVWDFRHVDEAHRRGIGTHSLQPELRRMHCSRTARFVQEEDSENSWFDQN